MAIPKPVKRLGSDNYYIRKTVPRDLRATLSRREFWVSLGTPDLRKAQAVAPRVLAEIVEQIEAAGRRTAPTAADLSRAVGEFARRELAIDLDRRRQYITQADFDREERRIYKEMKEGPALDEALWDLGRAFRAPEWNRTTRRHYEAELRKQLARGETALIQWAADEVVERYGYAMVIGSEPYRGLCHELMKAHLDVLQIQKDRDAGNFGSTTAFAAEQQPVGPTLMEAFKLYAKDAADHVRPHTLDQYEKFVGLFADFVGKPADLSTLTKANVRDWKIALEKLPVKATEMKQFQGMAFREIISHAEASPGMATITKRTVEKYIRALGSCCTWLVAQDYIDRNPTHGVVKGTKKSTNPVRSFTADELKRLFKSPVYTGCRSAKVDHAAGTVMVRDHRYWIPLIGLFTGARLGEIAQLMVDDIKQSHGQWIFHLTKEGKGEKTFKTEGSQRVVPIHSMLVRLGLLEYWGTMKQAGNERLFPEICRDTRGGFAGNPSRWFGRYLKRVKVKVGRENKFHSFRHSVSDAFRRGGYMDAQFQPLFGHASATVTGRYGIESETTIAQRVQMIEAITYDLDLSHLLPAVGQAHAAE